MARITATLRATEPFGARIEGWDFSKRLGERHTFEIWEALRDYKVLSVQGDNLSASTMQRFASELGTPGTQGGLKTHEEATKVALLTSGDTGRPPSSTWHVDQAWRPSPPVAGVLAMAEGERATGRGATLFVNTEAAYNRLPEDVQAVLADVRIEHAISSTFAGHVAVEKLQEIDFRFPPASHPVIFVHPLSGRRVVFYSKPFMRFRSDVEWPWMSAFNYAMGLVESAPVLQVGWSPDTLVIWDNIGTQHRVNDDFDSERRMMRAMLSDYGSYVPRARA